MSSKYLLLTIGFLTVIFLSTSFAAKWNRRTERDDLPSHWWPYGSDSMEGEEEGDNNAFNGAASDEEEAEDEMARATTFASFWKLPWRWPQAQRVPMQRIQQQKRRRANNNGPLGKMINNGYKAWADYKRKFGKFYHDQATENERMMAFLNNLEFVKKHNKLYQQGKVSYKVGINNLSDLSAKEYKKLLGYRADLANPIRRNASRFMAPMNVGDIPDTVDWRDHGYVTPVKNQGNCGSCWAFSSTGALEGQHMRATGKLVSLSEQNLVDCSKENNGCDGGLPSLAFSYIKTNKGIDTEKSYPYEAEDEKCHFKRSAVGATDTGYATLEAGDELLLKAAVATQGPISVGIDASGASFQQYTSGVYKADDCGSSPEDLDHAVLVVGYGTDPEEGDYWIVKNSWGTKWGMKGYILMARNLDNQCGIATDATYPHV